jgi:hypothetical protein
VRRRKTPISRPLPPLKIYIDDVERVVEILREHCQSVEVATEDYELDGVDELEGLEEERIDALEIQAFDPQIKVTLDPAGAVVYADDPSPKNKGIVGDIVELLRQRRRSAWYAFLLRNKEGNITRGYSTIVLKRRAEDVGFFFRKRDDILLLVVGAAIGSAATIATQAVLSQF